MIQFKLFEAFHRPYISTEEQVNKWLKENPNIKVKDFKFQGHISDNRHYEALYLMYEISEKEN